MLKKYLLEVNFDINENIEQDDKESELKIKTKEDSIDNNIINTQNNKKDKQKEINDKISKLNLRIIVNKDNPERMKSAYIISDNLKDIGIKNTIIELSSKEMDNALNEKNYDFSISWMGIIFST